MTALPQVYTASAMARKGRLINRIEACLREANGEWMTSTEIAAVVYADCADGGPNDAEGCIKVTVYLAKKAGKTSIESQRSCGYRVGKPSGPRGVVYGKVCQNLISDIERLGEVATMDRLARIADMTVPAMKSRVSRLKRELKSSGYEIKGGWNKPFRISTIPCPIERESLRKRYKQARVELGVGG